LKAKSKYGNKKTIRTIGDTVYKFDSLKEAKYFDKFLLLAKAKKITELTLQPKFLLLDTLRVEGHKTMAMRSYIADFKYIENGQTIIVDVKASAKFQDPVYRLKKHLFLAKYGHEVIFKEVY